MLNELVARAIVADRLAVAERRNALHRSTEVAAAATRVRIGRWRLRLPLRSPPAITIEVAYRPERDSASSS